VKSFNVAIIGAGWMGLACLAKFKENPCYNVTVFESLDGIGGVWHRDNAYFNLRIHTPAKDIELSDFPLPESIDRFERISAKEVVQYLSDYIKHKSLENCFQFNKKIVRIDYDSVVKNHTLYFSDSNEPFDQRYDYVINTIGFTERNIPVLKIKNKEIKILHSFDFKESVFNDIVLNRKKVAILGGSKTAAEIVCTFARNDYPVQWFYRDNYWFVCYDKYRQAVYSIHKGQHCSYLYKGSIIASLMLSMRLPWLAILALRMGGAIDTYGKRHYRFKKYHFGALDKNEIALLKEYSDKYYVPCTEENLYHLDADFLICCTGSGVTRAPFQIYIDGKQFELGDARSIFCSTILPEIPGIVFTAYIAFSLGIVQRVSVAHWVDDYIKSNLDEKDIRKHSEVCPPGFFFNMPLFHSKRYLAQELIKGSGFIIKNQVGTWRYFKWAINSLFSPNAAVPLKFKSLREVIGRSRK